MERLRLLGVRAPEEEEAMTEAELAISVGRYMNVLGSERRASRCCTERLAS